MSKNRIKVPALVIRSRAEMEQLAGQIVELKIKQQQFTAEMDDRINSVRAQFAAQLALLDDNMETAMEAARAWAEANPVEFNGAKSLELTQAVMGYRTGQPQLKTLSGWTWDRVLEKLKSLGAGAAQFVRTKAEIDKQGLLASRETLGPGMLREIGVRVVQEETFFVEPKLTQVEKREVVESQA